MSGLLETYEVRVNVKRSGTKHFSTHIGKEIEDELTEMFHIVARTPEQARGRARRYGHPVSVRKADGMRMRGDPEIMKLETPKYSHALVMDELIWLKRNKRIEAGKKDHEA